MRRVPAALAVSALVACVAGAAGAAPAQPAAVSAPTIALAATELRPGDRVMVSLSGWRARNVTLSVCGNLAKRGAVDCNLVASQALKLVNTPAPTPTELLVADPRGTCPCAIRASSATQDEAAVAPIDLIGWPVGPLVDPAFDALVAVSIDARAAHRGLLAAVRTTLAGPTDYRVKVAVRNLTTEALSDLSLAGSAGRSRTDQVVSFDIPSPGPVGPGQTWEHEVRVTLPAPVLRGFTWRVLASGAGSPIGDESSTRSLPIGLVLVITALVIVVVGILCRKVARRRERRRRPDDRAPQDVATLSPALTIGTA